MKTLLAIFLLIPSLSWAEKLTLKCSYLEGYFVLQDNFLFTKLSQYTEEGQIRYYKKVDKNDIFITFELKEITGPVGFSESQERRQTLISIENKIGWKYNRLTKTFIRGTNQHDCREYD